MRKIIIRWMAVVFICALTVCIMFGQSIRHANMLVVRFTHAMSGTLKEEYSITGEFVWRETEDAHTSEAQQYPIIRFETPDILPIDMGTFQFAYMGKQYHGTVLSQYVDNSKNYFEVKPEDPFWENNTVEDAISQGMHANYIQYSERFHTIIPSEAIHASEYESYIYLARLEKGYWSEDYVVQRRPVTVLATANGYSAIAERIMDSDYIILADDNAQLREGIYVREGKP